MTDKILSYWQKLQAFLDIDGDVVMLGFTAVIVHRIFCATPIDAGAAACYASAVGLFGYSKVKKNVAV